MPIVGSLVQFSAGTTAVSADVNQNFSDLKDVVNTYCVLTDVARTITVGHTFSVAQTFAGASFSGAVTMASTLGVTGAATFSSTVAATGKITGSAAVEGTQLISTVATGTAPLTITSTTKAANLNADKLDDQEGSYYLALDNATGTLAATKGGTGKATWTAGDLAYASASNTLAGLAIGTNGQYLGISSGAPAWQTGNLPSTDYLAAEFSHSTSTRASSGLLIAMGANETWRIAFDLRGTSAGAGGIATELAVPAGATGTVSAVWESDASNGVSALVADDLTATAYASFIHADAAVLRLVYVVSTAGTSGNADLKIGSSGGNYEVTLAAGSHVIATKLA